MDLNHDEIVLPSQPIEVHIPDAAPDAAPVDAQPSTGAVTEEDDLETEVYPEAAGLPVQIDEPDQPNGGE